MSKQKKIFKAARTLAPKITLNRRWTTWRQGETKIASSLNTDVSHALLVSSVFLNQGSITELLSPLRKILSSRHQLSYSSKVKNFCHYVGRARSFNKDLFMSRHTLRKFVRFGMLPGFSKTRC